MSTPTVHPRVRVAAGADRAPLVAMMRLHHAGVGVRLGRDRVNAALAVLLADPALGRVLVVDGGAEPLGYAIVTFGFDISLGGRIATFTDLYVRPSARRRGLGALLVAEIEGVARAAGAHHLALSVPPENEPAFALHRSFGYETPPRVSLAKALTLDATHGPS